MGFFGFFIISFIFTFVSIKFFKIVYNDLYIKKEFISQIITSLISLFLILIYVWTIKTDDYGFYKTSFLGIYFSNYTLLFVNKVLVFTGLIIIIVNGIATLVYNVFDKNKIIYYILSLLLYLALFFILILKNIINFDINEPHYLLDLFPPIGFRIECGIIFGILLAYLIDFNNGKHKNDIHLIQSNIKSILIIVLFLMIVYFQYNNTIMIYPTYFYEKVLNEQIKKYISFEPDGIDNSLILELKDLKYDDINIGNTVLFGRREGGSSGIYGDDFEDIEWLVLDKKDDEKQVLLLSKNGLSVVNNKAIEQRLVDYEFYNSDYNDDYEYDKSEEEKFNYNNSALRFEMYNCYKDFIDNNLSKDENNKYNDYNLKDNIVNSYLRDTNTYEKFFPLNKDEYNKYKKIDSVGNFYFKNNDAYTIFNNELRYVFYALRTFNFIDLVGYDFLCVDTPYYFSTYDDETFIKNNNYIIGNTFWFHDRFTEDYRKKNIYSDIVAKDLDNGLVNVVLRPAMWYRMDND